MSLINPYLQFIGWFITQRNTRVKGTTVVYVFIESMVVLIDYFKKCFQIHVSRGMEQNVPTFHLFIIPMTKSFIESFYSLKI